MNALRVKVLLAARPFAFRLNVHKYILQWTCVPVSVCVCAVCCAHISYKNKSLFVFVVITFLFASFFEFSFSSISLEKLAKFVSSRTLV